MNKIIITALMLVLSVLTNVSQANIITYDYEYMLEVVVVDGTDLEEPELGATGTASFKFNDDGIKFNGTDFIVDSNDFVMQLDIFGQTFSNADHFMNPFVPPRLTLNDFFEIKAIEFGVFESLNNPAPMNFVPIDIVTVRAFEGFGVKFPVPDVNPYTWEIVTFGFDDTTTSIPEPNAIALLLLAATLLLQARRKRN